MSNKSWAGGRRCRALTVAHKRGEFGKRLQMIMNSILTQQFNLRACQDWPSANPAESLISPVSLFFPPPSHIHSLRTHSLSSCPALLFLCRQRVYWRKRDGKKRECVCVGVLGAGMCKKCQSKTFTWKAVSSWKASCFTICLYIFFFFLTLSLCLSLSPSLLLPRFMPGELKWEQGRPPHVYSRLGGVIDSHWDLHDPHPLWPLYNL